MVKPKFFMVIKRINKKNYINFYNQFSIIKDFKVSEKITFYEKKEIEFWVSKPKDNLLYGVFNKNKCVGFCFCKIISNHWALIDNFYINVEYRSKNIGSKLQSYIENKLKRRNISYVSRVTRDNNISMHKFLLKNGYAQQDKYIWFDKFL